MLVIVRGEEMKYIAVVTQENVTGRAGGIKEQPKASSANIRRIQLRL